MSRTPAQLLGDPDAVPTRRVNKRWSAVDMRRSIDKRQSAPNFRLSMIKDLPKPPYDARAQDEPSSALDQFTSPPTYWIVHNRDPSPVLPPFTSRQSSFQNTAPRMYPARPQSFAAFSSRRSPSPSPPPRALPLPLPTYRSTTSLSYARIPGQWSVLTSSSSAGSSSDRGVGLGLGLATGEPEPETPAVTGKYPPSSTEYYPTW